MKFYKIWTIIPSLLGTQLELHFQQNLCNTLTPRRFISMTSCRTETETISRIQKVGPFDCCCSHASVSDDIVSLLVSGLAAHFVIFYGLVC